MRKIVMALGAVLVALLALVVAPDAAYARADPGRVADTVVPAQLARYEIPGAAVVVVAGGRQVYARGFGRADTARRTPVDPVRTRFLVGSVGRVFTATAVAQLAAAGRIDLHADVNRYLRTFKIRDTYPGRPASACTWRTTVTVRAARPPSPATTW
jgi:CubicO group peptidase (beta-lactamase class C family)